MPRWVVFDGAPSVEQCLNTPKTSPTAPGTWRTLLVDLPPPLSTTSSKKRGPSLRPTESQYEDAEVSGVTERPIKRAKEAGTEPAASQFADADTTGLFSSSRRAELVPPSQPEDGEMKQGCPGKRARREEELVKEEPEEGDETGRSTSLFLPAPSQPHKRHSLYRQTQPSHSVLESQSRSFRFPPSAVPEVSNVTSVFAEEGGTYDTTYAGDGTSIGAPPSFSWQLADITPLNQLRQYMGRNRRGEVIKTGVLASVIDTRAADPNARAPSTVSLMDRSGAQVVKLALWGDTGRQVLRVIQRGDVLFIGNVTVDQHNKQIQLKFSEYSSQLGICWRSYVEDDNDELYRFHEGWRAHIPQARRVLEEAEAFARFMR
ncbi:hypothetical protein JCM10213_002540 [Rhodosporidiobolus nylandii]